MYDKHSANGEEDIEVDVLCKGAALRKLTFH